MRRHPLDPVSLVAGLLFAGLSISLLTGRITASSRHLTLFWAVGAVILGLGLLTSGRRSHEQAVESGFQAGAPTMSQAGAQTESQVSHGTAGENGEE